MKTVSTGREFYEHTYHYEEDIVVPDVKRIARFFKCINFTRGQKYLDLGCGAGAALKFGEQHGLTCFGFDISARAIKLSRLTTKAETLVADGEMLPYQSEFFDVVTSLGSIEHFSSVERGLEETGRVTREGGQILLVVPNSYWVLNKLQLYKGTEQPQEMLATIGEWARLFKKHGLIVRRVGKDIGPRIFKNYHPLGMLKRALLKITLALPKPLAYQFVFICQKT